MTKMLGRATDTFVNLDLVTDNILKKFFMSKELTDVMNINIFTVDLSSDLVSRVIPKAWRNVDEAIVSFLHLL